MDSSIQALEKAIEELAALGSSLVLLVIAISIVPYVLFAVGLNTAAKRYGLRSAWMAWLPFARKLLLAELADIRRYQVGKNRRMAVQYEISIVALLGCGYAMTRTVNIFVIIIMIIAFVVLAYNQVFSYYYFYRMRDQENATAYFLLGLLVSPLNPFFVYLCR